MAGLLCGVVRKTTIETQDPVMAACCAILEAAQAAITLNGTSFPTCYGLVFTSRRYTALVRSYGLKQEFITPHCPQQSGMVERVIRTLKEQCIHRQRSDSIQHATRAIGDWIGFYNNRRPHQALDMKTPAEAFALAA
jgi:transposase InsO family protein